MADHPQGGAACFHAGGADRDHTGVGRAVGETAALVYTMGSDYKLAKSLTSSTRVLSVHLYYLIKEGLSFDRAFATATILIIIVLLVNFATNSLIGRMNKMAGWMTGTHTR